MDALEDIIDGQSVCYVLELLTEICHAKADHLNTNWADKTMAIMWTKAAKTIDACSGKIEV